MGGNPHECPSQFWRLSAITCTIPRSAYQRGDMKFHNKRLGRTLALVSLCLLGGVCSIAGLNGPSHIAVVAAAESQLTFATAEQAGRALYAAARSQDTEELERILGPESKAIVNSGDAAE